ncbi:MAG: hypothetical protein ABIH59_03160 [archaeon]
MFLVAGIALFVGSSYFGWGVAKSAQKNGISKAEAETYLAGEFKNKYPFASPMILLSTPVRELSYYILDVE